MPDEVVNNTQSQQQESQGQQQQTQQPQQPEKTFTQAELNAIVAKEKSKGRLAILKELGLEEDVDTAKQGIQQYKNYLESQKTELQKAQDSVNQAKKDKDAVEKELALTKQKLSVLQMGCQPQKVDDVCVLAKTRVTDTVSFEDAVKLIKTEYPNLFEQSVQDTGTGKNVPPKQHMREQGTTENYGEKLAKTRNSKKYSYFKN